MKFLLLILAITTNIYSSRSKNECSQIKELKARINVHSSNVVNVDTPNYKMRIIGDCKNGKCQIIKLNRMKSKFDPENKDANKSGYISLAPVNKKVELKRLNKAVRSLKKLARNKACKSKLKVSKNDREKILIQYHKDPFSDVFELKQGKVKAWTVQSPFGKNRIVF